MDVLTAAYAASGNPAPTSDLPAGPCARCGTHSDQLTRTTQVVSKLFTAFDGWHDATGRGMCPPCAWAHTAPELRQHPHLVTTRGETRRLTRPDLGKQLLAGPLPGDQALVVPLRPGRKHLLPEATWGHVTTDDARLPWAAGDVTRLEALLRLRGHGFGSRMLTDPAPPWPVFSRLTPATWPAVLADWDALKPWRTRRPWLDLALHATTTPTSRSAA